LNGHSLGVARLRVLDYAESGPQSLYLARRAGGSENSPVRDPTTSTELRCHAASSAQTVLNGVWPRNLDRDAERDVKTHFILTRIGLSVDAFLGAWTLGAHLFEG
jgi:hypothetical protein